MAACLNRVHSTIHAWEVDATQSKLEVDTRISDLTSKMEDQMPHLPFAAQLRAP